MKSIPLLVTASIVSLSACTPTTPSSTAVDPFIGKLLVADNQTVFLFNSDGTVGGTIRGEEIVGTYIADSREICSNYSEPEFLAGQEYCSVPDLDGETVIFKRRDGSESQPYTFEG
ncbi:hypothetical protein [Jannaschia faecimaris]|uniref:hypothetical protein n=1 Tax=Jannaschia faecimaris TaxID=1244108 RepID=UPI00111421F5|nr:hypothetical protein [Jannaschia faecimaris]